MNEEKRKTRWFFPIVTVDDAHDAIKIAYQTTFAIAGIQAVLLLTFSWLSGSLSSSAFDPVVMAAFAMTLRSRASRLAATVLFAYALLIGLLTLWARMGFQFTNFGGKNVILAALFVYASYKGLQGTFGFHRVYGTKTSFGSVARLALIIFGYLVGVTIVYFVMFSVPVVTASLAEMSAEWLGLLLMLPLVAIIFFGCLGLLPGTRGIRVTHAAVPEGVRHSSVSDNPSPQ